MPAVYNYLYSGALPVFVEQRRVRVVMPRPHVREHLDHDDHAAEPSDERRISTAARSSSPGGDTVDRCPLSVRARARARSASVVSFRATAYISFTPAAAAAIGERKCTENYNK